MRRRWSVPVVVVALGVAACGSTDNGAADVNESSVQASAPTSVVETTTSAPSGVTPSSTVTTTMTTTTTLEPVPMRSRWRSPPRLSRPDTPIALRLYSWNIAPRVTTREVRVQRTGICRQRAMWLTCRCSSMSNSAREQCLLGQQATSVSHTPIRLPSPMMNWLTSSTGLTLGRGSTSILRPR